MDLQTLRTMRDRLGDRLFGRGDGALEEQNYRNLMLSGAWFGPVDGGIFNFLPVFLARLGADAAIVSLLASGPSLIGILTFLPGGAYVERQSNLVRALERAVFHTRLFYTLIALAPLFVGDGTEPMELECAVRYVCDTYVSVYRSEGKLREGLRRLSTLRREFLPKLMAPNPHYLMRCLEVRNILDLAEVHFHACLERKETRGDFFRIDYPDKDPALDGKLVFMKIQDGKPVSTIRSLPGLNMDIRG
jgi:hypothetical protein